MFFRDSWRIKCATKKVVEKQIEIEKSKSQKIETAEKRSTFEHSNIFKQNLANRTKKPNKFQQKPANFSKQEQMSPKKQKFNNHWKFLIL